MEYTTNNLTAEFMKIMFCNRIYIRQLYIDNKKTKVRLALQSYFIDLFDLLDEFQFMGLYDLSMYEIQTYGEYTYTFKYKDYDKIFTFNVDNFYGDEYDLQMDNIIDNLKIVNKNIEELILDINSDLIDVTLDS